MFLVVGSTLTKQTTIKTMTSQIAQHVPVLTGPNYQAWRPQMESFLMASGQWLVLSKERPEEPTEVVASTKKSAGKSKDDAEQTAIETTDDFAEKYEIWEEKVEKWDETNMKALGNICLCLHHSIAFKFKEVLVAGTLWEQLKDGYGNPGVLNIYAEFKQAIETKVPDNADPSLAINKFTAHFGRLAENGVIIEDHLQGMMLLSKLPPSMDAIAQLMCQENNIKKIMILVV